MAKVKLNQKQIDALKDINAKIRLKVPNFKAIDKLVDIAIKNNDGLVLQKALKQMLDDEGSTAYASELKDALKVLQKDKFSFPVVAEQTLVTPKSQLEAEPNIFVNVASIEKTAEELKKEDEEKKARILSAVLKEIRTSEEKYNNQLHTLLDFYKELKTAPNANKKIKELVEKIKNIEKIVKLSDELLNRLKVARGTLEGDPRKHAAEVSKIFSKVSANWVSGGYGNYVMDFKNINKLIEELTVAKDPLFIKVQKVLMGKSGGIDVASHVILPVQRLPRYVLLLKEVVKNHTKALSGDDFKYDVITKVEASAKAFNEKERLASIQEALETLDKQLQTYVKNRTSILNGVRTVLGGADRDLKVKQAKSALTEIRILMHLKGNPDKLDIQGAPQEMVLELLKKLLKQDYLTIQKSKFGGKQGEFSSYLLAAVDKLDTDYSKSNNNPWNNAPVAENKVAKQNQAESLEPPVPEVPTQKVASNTTKSSIDRKLRKERAKAGEFKVTGTNEKGEGIEWSPVVEVTVSSAASDSTPVLNNVETEIKPKLTDAEIQKFNQVKKNIADVLKRAINQAAKAKVDDNLINDWNKEMIRILSINDKDKLKREGFALKDQIKAEIERVQPDVGHKAVPPKKDNNLRKDIADIQLAKQFRDVSKQLTNAGEPELPEHTIKNPRRAIRDLKNRLSNDGVKDSTVRDRLIAGLSKKEDVPVDSEVEPENKENIVQTSKRISPPVPSRPVVRALGQSPTVQSNTPNKPILNYQKTKRPLPLDPLNRAPLNPIKNNDTKRRPE